VKSLQEEMLDVARSREMNVEELVNEIKSRHQDMLTFDIRSALLPLLSAGELELMKDGKLKLAVCKEHVLA
jgi:predicted DNA-binding ribbon-helix-helix protein